jgi:hypothetical protein
MDQDPPGGPSSPIYRDPAEAAHARVAALERELSDARHDLAALQPRPPAMPAVLGGLQLVLIARALDLALVSLAMILPLLLPGAMSSFFRVSELAYLAAIVIAIVGVLKLAAVDGGGLIKVAVVGQCLCGAFAVLGLVQSMVSDFALPLLVFSLSWRVAILLADLPLLLYYRGLGLRLTAPGLATLATATAAVLVLQQVGNAVLSLLSQPRGPVLLHPLRWVVSAAVGALFLAVAVIAYRRVRRSKDLAPATHGTAASARAAAGLRLHRAGVLVKIIGALAGALLLVAAVSSRSLESTHVLTLALLLVLLVGSAIAFAGLVAYARATPLGGQGLMIAAAVLAGAGLTVDLCSALGVAVALLDGRGELLRSMQLLEPVGLALSLPALLLLLLSLQRAAQQLGERELAGRARLLAVLIGVVAPLVVLLRIPAVIRELGLLVFGVGVPLLGLAIYIVVRYLGLITQVSRAFDR